MIEVNSCGRKDIARISFHSFFPIISSFPIVSSAPTRPKAKTREEKKGDRVVGSELELLYWTYPYFMDGVRQGQGEGT